VIGTSSADRIILHAISSWISSTYSIPRTDRCAVLDLLSVAGMNPPGLVAVIRRTSCHISGGEQPGRLYLGLDGSVTVRLVTGATRKPAIQARTASVFAPGKPAQIGFDIRYDKAWTLIIFYDERSISSRGVGCDKSLRVVAAEKAQGWQMDPCWGPDTCQMELMRLHWNKPGQVTIPRHGRHVKSTVITSSDVLLSVDAETLLSILETLLYQVISSCSYLYQ
jgi:hypothetical protein